MKHVSIVINTIFLIIFIHSQSGAFAQEKTFQKPTKKCRYVPVDNFVDKSFSVYSKTNILIANVNGLLSQIGDNGPTLDQLSDLDEKSLALKAILPDIEGLIETGEDIISDYSSIPVLKVPRALKNTKAAVQALSYSAKQSADLMMNIIPAAKAKISKDSTAIDKS